MRVVLASGVLAMAALPALSAVYVSAPAPGLGIGWPALIGAIVAGLAIFLLGHRKI
jgi:uncharacterized membrane protein